MAASSVKQIFRPAGSAPEQSSIPPLSVPSALNSVQRVLAAFAVAIAFALVAWLGGVEPRWYLPAYLLLYAAAAVSLLLSLWRATRGEGVPVCALRSRATPLQWQAVCAPLLFIVGLPLLQIVAHSTSYAATTQTAFLNLLAAGCAFFLLAQAAKDEKFRAGLLTVFAIAAGILGGIAILQFFLTPQYIYGVYEIRSAVPLGPFVDRDHFAAAMELLLPPALVLATQRGKDVWRTLLWGLNPALAVAAVLLSASRGGALGVALELLWFALWRPSRTSAVSYAPASSWRSESRDSRCETLDSRFEFVARLLTSSPSRLLRRSRHCLPHALRPVAPAGPLLAVWGRLPSVLPRLAIPLTLAAMLVAYSFAAGFEPLLEKLKVTQLSTEARVDLVKSSLRMASDAPWMGHGLGTWIYVYPRYARFDDGSLYEHAHSEYAEWFAETGIVGAALLLLLFGTYCKVVRPLVGQDEACPTVRSGANPRISLLVGLAAFSVHAGVDFLFHIPALLLLFAIFAATALFQIPNRESLILTNEFRTT